MDVFKDWGNNGATKNHGERGAWASGTSTAAGPLVAYESSNSGGNAANSGSTFTVALATAATAHPRRLVFAPDGKLAGSSGAVFMDDYYWNGLNTSSATAFDPVFLQDTAVPPALTIGTVPKVVGYVLRSGAAFTTSTQTGGGGCVRLCSPAELRKVWVQRLFTTAASSANPAAGTSAQAFDQTLSIPARRFYNGVKARIRAVVNVGGVNSTDTHTFTLLFGGTAVVASAAVNPTSGDRCVLEAEVVCRGAFGASASISGSGFAILATSAKTGGLATNATVDNTAAITVSVTATYSVNNSANTSTLRELSVDFTDPV